MPDVAVRLATQADLPGILDLYRHLNPNDPVISPDEAGAIWSRLLGSGLTTVLIAMDGPLAASTCTLVIVPNLTRAGRPYALIENVVTHADRRRLGLGRRVLAAALDKAWAAGCYKVMLASGSRREETLRFYEAAGFTRGGKTFFEIRRP
jgi:GNAT superfamily N-acetyltransferase